MLCTNCGNEVVDARKCPICAAGRGGKKRRVVNQVVCPRCADPLESQNWDGIPVFCCPTCRGSFFPERGLEEALNKLRATCSPMDVASVLSEFKDRFTRQLPSNIRYKDCPVCATVMTRRNYATVSGVIVDVCGKHGTWVDESAFADLANFITRGGDILASEVKKIRTRPLPASPAGNGPSILERLFGTK